MLHSATISNPSHPPLTSTVDALEAAIRHHVRYSLGKTLEVTSKHDLFLAVAMTVRDRLVDTMFDTEARYRAAHAKRLYYLSMEFLIGRSLGMNLYNLGILEACQEALHRLGVDLDELHESEADAALGNGGLGRLAACFLESLATLGMPGYGYGIRYDYGLFKQELDNGYQKEQPDHWLDQGTAWQIERRDEVCAVPVYGRIEPAEGTTNPLASTWVDWRVVLGVPYDVPIVGYGGRTVNFLRLYAARSSHEFDMQIFQRGDYLQAVEQKIASEKISKVLYPSDAVEAGRELRLLQEYFLVACAIRDIVRRYRQHKTSFEAFPTQVAIQFNDTHPALAVAELMRVLIDDQHLPWDKAWTITRTTLGYTNHTLLPEALEKWSVPLLEYVLPRHIQIIYAINHRFLQHVATTWPGDLDRMRRMSLIEEGTPKQVRMAHLAVVGSHAVNGVAALHSSLLKSELMPDFAQLWPEKFHNKTNGVTQRRWLLKANPRLVALLQRVIGDSWIIDLDKLRGLEAYAEDTALQHAFLQTKYANKITLARFIKDVTQLSVAPQSLFDIQIKRIHEYKRQLLHVMYIIHTYLALIEDRQAPLVPRTHIFAGKAAPGYWAAKQIVKLINNVGQVINNDPRVEDQLKVVFLPDYRVFLAEKIIPAADISEQISTAGTEASGTGNMKLAMNGALTVGTLDGANIELMEEIGAENMFLFGLRAEEIRTFRTQGTYRPREYYEQYPDLRRVMDALRSNLFCPRESGLFTWIYQAIVEYGDPYFHLADMQSYIDVQRHASTEFAQPTTWARKALLNVARIGKFSSDRTIREYARDIWHIQSY
jgi:starch phosphorylase